MDGRSRKKRGRGGEIDGEEGERWIGKWGVGGEDGRQKKSRMIE